MADPYTQGYQEGRSEHADNRACPYEGHDDTHRWLNGFEDGRDSLKTMPRGAAS